MQSLVYPVPDKAPIFPSRRSVRVGERYPCNSWVESFGSASRALMTAQFRSVYSEVRRFDGPIPAVGFPEPTVFPRVMEALGAKTYWSILHKAALYDCLCARNAAVVVIPWSPAYSNVTSSIGVDWVGSARGLVPEVDQSSGAWWAFLAKGVSSKFNAIHIQDDLSGQDLWFSVPALERLWAFGAVRSFTISL